MNDGTNDSLAGEGGCGGEECIGLFKVVAWRTTDDRLICNMFRIDGQDDFFHAGNCVA